MLTHLPSEIFSQRSQVETTQKCICQNTAHIVNSIPNLKFFFSSVSMERKKAKVKTQSSRNRTGGMGQTIIILQSKRNLSIPTRGHKWVGNWTDTRENRMDFRIRSGYYNRYTPTRRFFMSNSVRVPERSNPKSAVVNAFRVKMRMMVATTIASIRGRWLRRSR